MIKVKMVLILGILLAGCTAPGPPKERRENLELYKVVFTTKVKMDDATGRATALDSRTEISISESPLYIFITYRFPKGRSEEYFLTSRLVDSSGTYVGSHGHSIVPGWEYRGRWYRVFPNKAFHTPGKWTLFVELNGAVIGKQTLIVHEK